MKGIRIITLLLTLLLISIQYSYAHSNISNQHLELNKLLQRNIAIFSDAKKTHWFEQGNPKALHQMYVVAEPNCSACHYLYNTLYPYVAKGEFNVRWILVSFIKPSSAGKAAAIMFSKNPALALNSNEANFDEQTETGAIAPLQQLSQEMISAIKSNIAFMQKYNFVFLFFALNYQNLS